MSNLNYRDVDLPGEVWGIALVSTVKLVNGRFEKQQTKVVTEKEFSIYINGKYFATASLTDGMEREFVVGYLFGQGFIGGYNEIESLVIERNAAKVTARTADYVSKRAENVEYRIVSAGGKSAFFDSENFKYIPSDVKIGSSSVYKAMNMIFNRGGLYSETEAVHSCGLFSLDVEPLCFAEDIGRHNSLDKAIGCGLINKVDFTKTFVVSTGRMTSEMVLKICRANIPVVATKAAVTKSAINIGEKCGLTVIGFVKDKGTKTHTDMSIRIAAQRGMKIYTNPQKILLD